MLGVLHQGCLALEPRSIKSQILGIVCWRTERMVTTLTKIENIEESTGSGEGERERG